MSHCFGAVLCLSSNFLCFLHVLGAVKVQSLQFVLDDTFLIPELLFCFYSIQSCLLAFCPLGKVYCCMDHQVWRAFCHIFVLCFLFCPTDKSLMLIRSDCYKRMCSIHKLKGETVGWLCPSLTLKPGLSPEPWLFLYPNLPDTVLRLTIQGSENSDLCFYSAWTILIKFGMNLIL